MSLSVDAIAKRFGQFPALKGVSLTASPGEFLALLGPSGSGKTTLLRVLAGLEAPDSGQVLFEGEDFLALTPRARRIGMVFQSYALFRHMTVARNIAFGLNVLPGRQRPGRTEVKARVEQLLKLIQLEGLGGRYPGQLSGGQRQRVALARALAIQPRLLLLDEPFGALDAKVRKELRRWLRGIHDETGQTTIFVTHDQEEAMDLADRVAVLREGRIEQVGRPAELHERPVSAYVFDFLGDSNRLSCRLENGRARFDGFDAEETVGEGEALAQSQATAWFRPHETILSTDGPGIAASVSDILRRGAVTRVECRGPDGTLLFADLSGEAWGVDKGARVRLRPRKVFVFAEAARANEQ